MNIYLIIAAILIVALLISEFIFIFFYTGSESKCWEAWARAMKSVHPITGEIVSSISLEDMAMVDLNGKRVEWRKFSPENKNLYKLVNARIFEV